MDVNSNCLSFFKKIIISKAIHNLENVLNYKKYSHFKKINFFKNRAFKIVCKLRSTHKKLKSVHYNTPTPSGHCNTPVAMVPRFTTLHRLLQYTSFPIV